MGKLDQGLAEAEQVFRQMRGLAESGEAEGKRALVQLRSRYAMLMLDILEARRTDDRLLSDPGLAREFDRRFLDLRQALAEHQATWRLQAIEDDTAGYMASAGGISQVQDDFYLWARGRLAPPGG
jgi:hypothetical protein